MQLDIVEQYGRKANLRISGIADPEGEDTVGKVITIFNETMSCSPRISRSDSERAHRLARKRLTSHSIQIQSRATKRHCLQTKRKPKVVQQRRKPKYFHQRGSNKIDGLPQRSKHSNSKSRERSQTAGQ